MKIDLPEKRYYGIGEVAKAFSVNNSLIRFWEKEFDILKPKKNNKGDRKFTPVDIKNLELIYHLVKERGFTLDGAKKIFKRKQTQ
jgi:DNA-binding transcriptional MerR regulator